MKALLIKQTHYAWERDGSAYDEYVEEVQSIFMRDVSPSDAPKIQYGGIIYERKDVYIAELRAVVYGTYVRCEGEVPTELPETPFARTMEGGYWGGLLASDVFAMSNGFFFRPFTPEQVEAIHMQGALTPRATL